MSKLALRFTGSEKDAFCCGMPIWVWRAKSPLQAYSGGRAAIRLRRVRILRTEACSPQSRQVVRRAGGPILVVANRKETHAPAPEQSPAVSDQSAVGCLARLFWMVGGSMGLVFGAMFIWQSPSAFSVYDLGYWGVVLLLVATRYVDITRLGGTTTDLEPATLSHWRRYTLAVLGIWGAIWLIAHLARFLIQG